MLEKRVKIQSVVENQLPDFLRTDNYKAGEFLKTYYKSAEYQGGPVNILENIDQYTKVGTYTSIVGVTSTTAALSTVDETITVRSTNGWPDQYGLLKINDEIISYTGKTATSFTGCIRGFSGITTYHATSGPDELIFESSEAEDHLSGSGVTNLSSLFLNELFRKLKAQFLPGFEDRKLYTGLNAPNFIRQAKDFYSSKGTEDSFEILFKALYGAHADIIKPQDYLFIPSDAGYRRSKELVVEKIEGNITDLKTQTVYQKDQWGNTIAYGSAIDVEEITRGNSTYYKISIDYDQDKDTPVFGSVFGDFRIDPHTKIIGNVAAGSTYITVDSTLGFGTTGSLSIDYDSVNSGIITYTSKSVNQFYGCSGISSVITNTSTIYQNVSSYGYDSAGEEVTFRVKGALGDFVTQGVSGDIPYFEKDDIVEVQSLGFVKHNECADSLLYNVPATLKVKSISQYGTNYIIETYDEHPLQLAQLDCANQDVCFRIGDPVELVNNNGQVFGGAVIAIDNETKFTCNGFSGIQLAGYTFDCRKNVSKVNSLSNPILSNYLTDVTSSYFNDDNGVYVATNSLPRYSKALTINDGTITLSGSYSGDTINKTAHGFLTGEEVHYRPDNYVSIVSPSPTVQIAITTTSELGDLKDGTYFIKKVDEDNFKLAQSRGDIQNDIFVSVTGIASAQLIKPILAYNNSIDATKQLSYIPPFPINASDIHETSSGTVGIFVNGVDIISYKSEDYVYYGSIVDLPVVAPGTDYDVINPPRVVIKDAVGTAATATATVVGKLEKIEVVDPGSDFVTDPIINISGGNGKGAEAKANLKYKKIEVVVDTSAFGGYISTDHNIIGFTTYHKFRDADGVVYDTNGNTPIGIGSTVGSSLRDSDLANKSTYYVGVVGLTSITLHNKPQDALAGINTINITGFGTGNQSFTTVEDKGFLASVSVVTAGEGYSNNNVRVVATGINTASNTITYNNHGFADGDLVTYRFSETVISGLTTDQNYWILKKNDNQFQLAAAGIGTTVSDANYRHRLSVDLKSEGTGTHDFNYPEISVSISGVVGIATTNVNIFEPVIQPYFRGGIDKINIVNGGAGYGSSEIINFERQTLVTFENGENAQVKPLVSNGVIKEILIQNGGTGYEAPPNLKISGTGARANLTPVLTNGVLTSVKINDGGVGYTTATTFVDVIPSGKGASVRTNIKSWNINNFERYESRIGDDDGLLSKAINDESSGTFASLTAPRELRKRVYSKNNDGSKRYGTFDLVTINGLEQPSTFHSPIIGWAWDGHPIYGPYGYNTPEGGAVRALQSGYEMVPDSQRPPSYPQGFFIEDYTFTGSGDLDERNGRFGRTPDYPKGIYAYFATINDGPVESSGSFKDYKLPQFPYIIGKYYKAEPNRFNFIRQNNQVQFDFNGLLRNTKPSKVNSKFGFNDYLPSTTDDPNQKGRIEVTNKGNVPDFSIVAAGTSYKSGEYIDFSAPKPVLGDKVIANIDRVKGKKIVSFASSTLNASNVEFMIKGGLVVGYATQPHNFENRDFATISGLSTNAFKGIEGKVRINNSIKDQNTWYLQSGIGTVGETGLTTTVSLLGSYTPLFVRENNILGIGTSATNLEQWKVLNVDPLNKRMRVQREYNNTTGVAYSSGSLVLDYPSKVFFPVGIETYTSDIPSFQRYFIPSEVVGLGTTAIVGIGTTVTYDIFNNITPPGIEEGVMTAGIGYTSQIIPVGTILIHNHSFQTGDKLVYSNGGGTSLTVTDGSTTFALADQSIVYAIKESNNLLGISTTKVGLGSTGSFVGLGSTAIQLSFTSAGAGVTHSFKSVSEIITGNIDIYEATFRTEEPHGLVFDDRVDLSVRPGFTTSIFVQYNDYNQRVVFERSKFTSIDTTSNTITLPNHGFITGEKVIFTTGGTAPTGLDNNGMYYVIKISKDSFKLGRTQRDTNGLNPVAVRISAGGSGEHFVSSINPRVNAILGTKVSFALTDHSLSFVSTGSSIPAFEMKFYRDEEFNDEFVSSKTYTNFEVSGVGTVGVTADAAKVLQMTDYIPSKLYYRFEPINVDLSPSAKAGIIVDKEQISGSAIFAERSTYTAKEFPVGLGSTTFSYLLGAPPERDSYIETDGSFDYTTNSSNATGPIASIKIMDPGKGYDSLPGITSIKTEKGARGIVRPIGNMGTINSVKLQDVGYGYPSDPTLKVVANVPEVLLLEELCSLGEIGITSAGKNYLVPPNLLVKDGVTGKIIDDLDLDVSLISGSISAVEVLRNTKSLSDTQPTFIPINNSNGVGIRTVGFNTISKEVSVWFDVGFSTAGSFPFNVGDSVYVENIGIVSTGTGYNSADYEYKSFKITATDENIGGIGSVSYQLDTTVTDPGLYSTVRSYGRMIPPQDLPIFNAELIKNNFSIGETVWSNPSPTNEGGNIEGVVSTWDPSTKIIKINSKNEFDTDTIITGESSLSKARIAQKYDVKSYFDIAASPIVIHGWTKNTGMLDESTQRMIDSDYYQYFSYSIKSKIAYDTWNEVVSSLNHTSGFKKFADLIIENDEVDSLSKTRIKQNDVDVTIDLSSKVSINCDDDFDLVTEKTLTVSGKTFGNSIIFQNRALTDYEESIGNRVLSIDDFSTTFNSDRRTEKYAVVDTFPIAGSRFRKYIISVNDTQFTDNVQTSIVEMLIDDMGNGYIQEYADVDTELHGYYDLRILGSEGQLLFYPEKFTYNNYDCHGLVYSQTRAGFSQVGLATQVGIVTVADIAYIEEKGTTINSGITTAVNILSFSASSTNSAKFTIVTDQDHKQEVVNMNILQDGTDVIGVEYGRMNNNDNTTAANPGLGTYGATLSGGVVYINFTPSTSGAGITFNINQYTFNSGVSTIGIGTTTLENGNITAGFTTIAASGSPGITTLAKLPATDDGFYALVEVEDLTNNDFQYSEIVAASNNSNQSMTEYGVIDTNGSGIGTFGVVFINNESHLRFTPIASVITNIKTLITSNQHVALGTESVSLNDNQITCVEGLYAGTDTDVKRAFGLTHGGDQIFTRNIDASDSTVVNLTDDTIILPNHFFVSGERLTYTGIGAGTTSNIGIGTTTVSGISTDKLPNDLYAIKVDDKSIRLAGSAEDALVSAAGNYFNLTSVGIGTSHVFQAHEQNSKVVVALNNNIQDPIVSTGVTYTLAADSTYGGELFKLSGITSIFGADLLKINDEIVKVKSVGIGSTNNILVQRGWMGTGFATHISGSLLTKYEGAYNIVGNTLNFYTAPIGPRPAEIPSDPNEVDWTGIQTHSTFQGRMFMRSGVVGQTTNTYADNLIFDSISQEFNGIGKTFTMKANGQNVTGFSTNNALVLINEIAQGPTQGSRINDFLLTENAGITSIVFSGYAASVTNDVNTGTVPVGGVLVSLGSTSGFGLQPLVAAGATAIVSGFGTISSLTLGNAGSGYRAGINTLNDTILPVSYEVGIRTNSDSYTAIGTALISGGYVTGFVLDTPYTAGTGYTFTDAPEVIVKDPLSYSNIPLLYHPDSPGVGVGTNARVNIQVSQYSNVTDFETINNGYGYRESEILTIPTGGVAGIPTTNISSLPVISGGNYAHTFVSATTNGVTANTGTQYTPTNATFNATTGDMVLTVGSGHGLTGAAVTTATNAQYNPVTGVTTITVANHGFSNGDLVKIVDGSLTFTCDKDGHATNHSYPRNTDPASVNWLTVANKTTNTFEVTVLDTTPSTNTGVHTFVSAAANGILKANNTVSFATSAITLSCTMDGNTSNKSYPRATDPVAGANVGVRTTTSTTITVDVGASPIVRYPVHYATYNGTTGIMELTIGNHSLTAGTSIKLANESLVFTCDRDNHSTKHGYPRPSDPYYDTAINILGTGTQTISMNVGVATDGQQYNHTFVGAGVSEFRLNVDQVFNDKFSSWHFGGLDILDSLAEYFDGESQVFLLRKGGSPISIKAAKGSPIDVQQTIMVFINDILQEPGAGYIFKGGSQITFTEAPKKGDSNKILFYKGTAGVDVVSRDIVETIKVGDFVTIDRDDDQPDYLQQTQRAVTGITTTDTITTSPYIGSGLSTDTTLVRPLTWCRQTEDVVIDGVGVGKDRPLYEPRINPAAYIIKNVGIGTTMIYVDDVRPFFDPLRENYTVEQKSITFISQDSRVGAAATAVVSLGGTISSFVISEGGVGYTTDPLVSVGNPVGLGTTFRAAGDADNGLTPGTVGVVTNIKVSSPGSGYTFTSPPNVLIAPPTPRTEVDEVINYNGDSGIIVGFGTTSISAVDRAIFDFHIPLDSSLRKTSYVGTAITLSGINTGDYFVVRDSNVGLATTAITSRSKTNEIVAIGTEFYDNVYQVDSVSNVTYNVIGVGTTTVRRVYSRISGFSTVTWGEPDIYFDSTHYTFDNSGLGSGTGYPGIITMSDYFGNYSWGLINVVRPKVPQAFSFRGDGGIGGISTSALVVRTKQLKHYDYSN